MVTRRWADDVALRDAGRSWDERGERASIRFRTRSRTDRPVRGPGPRRCGAREADQDGICRVRTHRPTCGGNTVRRAKADLVPTSANVLPDYESFADLEAACEWSVNRSTAGRIGRPAGYRMRCWLRNRYGRVGWSSSGGAGLRPDPAGMLGLHDKRERDSVFGAARFVDQRVSAAVPVTNWASP